MILKTWNQKCSPPRLLPFRFRADFRETCHIVTVVPLEDFIPARLWFQTPETPTVPPASPGTMGWSWRWFWLWSWLWLSSLSCTEPHPFLLPPPGLPPGMYCQVSSWVSLPLFSSSPSLVSPASSPPDPWKVDEWAASVLSRGPDSQSEPPPFLPPLVHWLLTGSVGPREFLKWSKVNKVCPLYII